MNLFNVLTYEKIIIKINDTELDKNKLQRMELVKKINDHVRLRITGIVPDDQREKYIQITQERTPITLDYLGVGDNTPLFKGMIVNVEVKMVRDIYYFDIEGISYTFDLDIKLKKRSFQDQTNRYENLARQVIDEYEGADFQDNITHGAAQGKFIIQYQETDWEFLKRMASRFNTGLVAEATMDKPKFWFGIPEGKEAGEFQEVFYSVKKRIAAYRDSAANYIPGIAESDFVYYELQTEQPMNIGDIVKLNGKQLYVFETRVIIEESVLKNFCVLAPKNGLKQNLMLHPHVTGVTVNGTVIGLQKDQVQVHLEIDKEQDTAKAFWFTYTTSYTTEGNTGWYCMPELGDTVSLYFPNAKEEEGVVCNSIRQGSQGGNKIDDPGVKYFRTKFGKELMFNDKQIVITGKDGEILINLEEEKGIEIYSEKDIKIQCKNDMFIDVGHKMTVTAGVEIGIKCKASSIVMDGVTYIKGTNVKEN